MGKKGIPASSPALHLFRSCSVLTSRQGMWMDNETGQQRGVWAGLARFWHPHRNDTGFICWPVLSKSLTGIFITLCGSSTDSSLFISGQLTVSFPPPLPLHRNSKAEEDDRLPLKVANGLPFSSLWQDQEIPLHLAAIKRITLSPRLKNGKSLDRCSGNSSLFFQNLRHSN